MAHRGRQARVTRHQGHLQRFGQDDIRRVVRREVVPQGPDAHEKEVMRIADQGPRGQIVDGFLAPLASITPPAA